MFYQQILSDEEILKLYMGLSKKELAKMLLESNKLIKELEMKVTTTSETTNYYNK